MKILIILVLLVIIGSLGSGLYFLLKDRNRSPRTAGALTARIALSLGLFVALIAAFASGLIKPHGIRPNLSPAAGQVASPSP